MFGENCRPDEYKLFAYPRLYNCVSIYNIGPALSCPDTTPPNCIDLRTTPPTGTGPRMKGCKFSPVAVVLGDFKICVFGKILYSDSKDVFFPPCFEILDTKNRKWTSLPEIPFNHSVSCQVQSHCVRGSCLIIQTIPYGIYGINVDYYKPQWVKLDQSDNIDIDHFRRIEENWTMVGKTLCSPFCAITRGGLGFQDISFEAPEWRESLIRYYEQRQGQLLHSDELGLCIVRTGLNYLLVDIVKLDHEALETLGGSDDLSGWKNIKSNKSFTFELTSHPWNFLDSIIGCFPIKVASAPAALSNQPFVGSHEQLGFQNQLWSFVINKSTKKCSHCGYTNHTVEYCFKIHGFPPGYKEKKFAKTNIESAQEDAGKFQ